MERGKFILVAAAHTRRRDVTWKSVVFHVSFAVADDQWTAHAQLRRTLKTQFHSMVVEIFDFCFPLRPTTMKNGSFIDVDAFCRRFFGN
jgi:hypothetical protein